MSIKRNIIANYIGQFYVALIGILLVPIYVKYMGAEAYGLVGFYVMLQAWFSLLDMGFTPTMARESSRYLGGAVDAVKLRSILRALEGIFIVIAVIGAISIIAASDIIATRWLKVNELPIFEVKRSLVLISIIISLRWVSGLYRGVIRGFERIVWLNTFNIIIATIRFVFVIPILNFVGTAPSIFFGYQLIISVLELIVLVFGTYRLLPPVNSLVISWDWKPLRESIGFSLSVAFAGMVWVVATQTDRLIISGLISLADFAYFTLAVLVASGVMIVTRPISGALLPRMTKLYAEGDQRNLIKLYRNATQAVAVISIPIVIVMSVYSREVLFAWTGDNQIADKASQVLSLYALGNGLMVLAAFPYYLQYAKGDLRWHLIGNALFVVLFIPAIYFLVKTYGMLGAGYAWVISNLMFFILYVPIVHQKFTKGLHLKWLVYDMGIIAVLPLIFILAVKNLIPLPEGRISVAFYVLAAYIGALLFAMASTERFRKIVKFTDLKKRIYGSW